MKTTDGGEPVADENASEPVVEGVFVLEVLTRQLALPPMLNGVLLRRCSLRDLVFCRGHWVSHFFQ